MKPPKVKKKLSDIFPIGQRLASKSKEIAVGVLMIAIGAFASSASSVESAVPKGEPLSIQRNIKTSRKLVFDRPSVHPQVRMEMSVQHYSHYSHGSHYSHHSHHSHHSHYSSW